jgi:hypothetical protein
MTLTLQRPDPDVVTAVTWSADLLREGCELLLDLVDIPASPPPGTEQPTVGPHLTRSVRACRHTISTNVSDQYS